MLDFPPPSAARPHDPFRCVSRRVPWYCCLIGLLFLCFKFGLSANAQSFEIYGDPQHPFGPGSNVVVVNIQNDTTNDQINSFAISNIYSIAQPTMYFVESYWDYNFIQNSTNSYLWNLYASDSFALTYVGANKSQEIMFIAEYPNGAKLLTGVLNSSAGFVKSGVVQSNPSTFVGPVGWQSGPFLASVQVGQTSGTMQLSWSGADGNVYVDYKGSLTETNWQNLAGPFSGGVCTIPISTNAASRFFRLRLEQ